MKIFLPIFFLTVITFSVQAQSIIFKPKYQPDHSYKIAFNMNMNMAMDVQGTAAEMQAVKDKGIKLPMQMTSKTSMGATIKTGNLKSDNYFPLVITYDNVIVDKTMNGEAKPSPPNPLNGLSIICRYSTGGKIQVDSVPGKAIDNEMKDVLTKTISSFVNQLHFPDRPMNIGDTCSQQIPFSMPVPGINIQMTIKVLYKLVSLKNDLANFDVTESLNMDMTTQQAGKTMALTGNGSGNGTMLYDIKQNIPTSTNIDFKMNYRMLMGDLVMLGDATIMSQHTTSVTSGGQ